MVQSLYKQPTPCLKNHMRNLDNYRQAVESPKSHKSWNLMGYFCLKITFLQLKHIQRIYPTLLSTSCVKIHQMTYVIFETICHFSRNSPSIYESENFQTCHCSHYFTKFIMSILEPRVSFSSNFASFFSVMRLTLLYLSI